MTLDIIFSSTIHPSLRLNYVIIFNEIQLNVYRFSISWSRVIPKVGDKFANDVGVSYYKKLIYRSF